MNRLTARPFAALLALAVAACSEGAGTLVLTVDQVPPFVGGTEILIAGGITRTPAKATDLIVSIAGGAAPAADTLRGNRYEVRVQLTTNASNQLTIMATDVTGSTSNSLNVTVLQDGQGPTIAQATPADVTDGVALNTPISLTFSEPVVVAVGGGIRLSRQGFTFAGTTTRSADSLTLTFVPTDGISPNAIYHVAVSGVTDVAQNAVLTAAATCFVTTPTGSTATMSFTESATDTIYQGGANPGLLPPNLIEARFAREGTDFSGVFRFTGPRIFARNALNQGSVILELDVDNDSTTGFWTYKDTVFYASTTFGPSYATTYASGTKAEFIIDLEPFAAVGDSAFVGRKNGALSVFIDGVFIPGTCGPFLAFAVPFSFLGDDDGLMNGVALGYAETETPLAFFLDPMPLKNSLGIDVRAPTLAPIHVAAPYVTASRTPRLVRLPPRRVPLR